MKENLVEETMNKIVEALDIDKAKLSDWVNGFFDKYVDENKLSSTKEASACIDVFYGTGDDYISIFLNHNDVSAEDCFVGAWAGPRKQF